MSWGRFPPILRARGRPIVGIAPVALLVNLLVLLVALLMPAPAAAATSLRQARQALTACGPGGLGDRLVPDRGPWFDFSAACAVHDACYTARLGRIPCDEGFRVAMLAHCSARAWYQRAPCRDTAGVYSEAVRRFGHLFY